MKWLKYPGLWIQIKDDDMKKQYLTFGQRVQLYNFIKTVGKLNGEHWEYNEGWDDKKVAEKFNYTPGNVTTVRSELGKLRTYINAPYAKKLGDLHDRIAFLEAKMMDLEAKFNRIQLKEHFHA